MINELMSKGRILAINLKKQLIWTSMFCLLGATFLIQICNEIEGFRKMEKNVMDKEMNSF